MGPRDREKGMKRGLLALALPVDKGDDERDSEDGPDSEDTSDEDLEMACDDLLTAIEEKDSAAMAEAFRLACRCCK